MEKTKELQELARDVVRRHVQAFGKSETSRVFDIRNRGTLNKWLAGGPIRPGNVQRILQIASEQGSDPVAGYSPGDLVILSVSENVGLLGSVGLCAPGDYVIHDQDVALVQWADNNDSKFILQKKNGSSIVSKASVMLVLRGTVRYFSNSYRLPVAPLADVIAVLADAE